MKTQQPDRKWFICFLMICCLPLLFIACGDDDDDDDDIVKPPPPRPGVPKGVAGKVEDDGVVLTWNVSDNTESYQIFRSTKQNEGYGEDPIGTTSKDKTTYTDKTAIDGIYFYKVRAVSPKIEGVGRLFNESTSVRVDIRRPQLAVEPKKLDFGDSGSTLPLKIMNTGRGVLDWNISADVDWLTFNRAEATSAAKKALSGSLKDGEKEVVITVRVNRTKAQPRNKPYPANITINSTQVPVTMIVRPIPFPYVEPKVANFGLERGPITVEVGNAGTGTLNWIAKKERNVPWLRMTPTGGNGVTRESPDRLTLELIPSELEGLPPGSVTETITVTATGVEHEPKVTVTVEIPEIPITHLNPTSVNFGESQDSRIVQISNIGTGTLRWSARKAKNENWLRITPGTGRVFAGDSQPLTLEIVSAEVDRLSPGEYSETVIVEGGKEQKSLTVTMRIPQPEIRLSHNTLRLGDGDTQKAIEIENIGEGTLKWETRTNREWVRVSPPSGSTPAGSLTDVRIEFVEGGCLDAGEHTANVTFTSNGGTQTLRVELIKTGQITGTVRHLFTDAPLPDAVVEIPIQTVHTGPDGRFVISYTDEGEYTLNMTKLGYIGRQERVPTACGRGEKEIWLSPIAQPAHEIADPNRIITPKQIAFRDQRGYVTNNLDNSVVVINTATEQVIAKIPLECGDAILCDPRGIATNPRRAEVYVTQTGADAISVINTNTNTDVRQIDVGNFPVACAVSHDGRTLYVSNQRDGNISVINLDNLAIIDQIRVGSEPAGMAISPDDTYLFVSNKGQDIVSVVDLNARLEVDKIPVGSRPDTIAIAENGRYAYVANSFSGDLSIIDIATRREVERIDLSVFVLVGVAALREETHEREIAYAVDNNGAISVIEMPLQTVQETGARVGGGEVQAIGYDAAVRKFFVLDAAEGQIAVLE
jgi:YVTN family beta-propeller protein